MAGPSPNYNTGTVTGHFVDLSGAAIAGTITFRATSNRLTDPAAEMTIISVPKTVTLSGTGEFSVELPATDDPDISPTGFTYRVTEAFTNPGAQSSTYSIAVPADTVTDLSTVVAVNPSTGVTTIKGDPGSPAYYTSAVESVGDLPAEGSDGEMKMVTDLGVVYAWNSEDETWDAMPFVSTEALEAVTLVATDAADAASSAVDTANAASSAVGSKLAKTGDTASDITVAGPVTAQAVTVDPTGNGYAKVAASGQQFYPTNEASGRWAGAVGVLGVPVLATDNTVLAAPATGQAGLRLAHLAGGTLRTPDDDADLIHKAYLESRLSGITPGGGTTNLITLGTPLYPATHQGLTDACDDADDRGFGTPVYIPAGVTVTVEGTFSMAGRRCRLIGDGGGRMSDNTWAGSVIQCINQTGPVIDFEGYTWTRHFAGKVVVLDHLVILGDGTEDLTGYTKVGVRTGGRSAAHTLASPDSARGAQNAVFRDLIIAATGGHALHATGKPGSSTYMCDFERITLVRPQNAGANNVPYLVADEVNCSRFTRIGFIEYDPVANTSTGMTNPPDGCALFRGSQGVTNFAAHETQLDAFWFESITVPANGTIMHLKTNSYQVRDMQFIDCRRSANAAGTSYVLLEDSDAGLNVGGNEITGYIPGNGDSGSTKISHGVTIGQSYNSVLGQKGQRGNNVRLLFGTLHCSVRFNGSQGAASEVGWLDESGSDTHRLVDEYLGIDLYTAKTTAYRARRDLMTKTADYTCTIADSNGTLVYNNATTPGTFTIPAQSSVPWHEGTQITFVNRNLATLTIAGSGIVAGSTTSVAQGKSVTATRVSQNAWVVN